MKFLTPTFAVLLGASICCETEGQCTEEPRKLEQYEDGNRGLGLGDQWEGKYNRWIGDYNAILGNKNSLVGDRNQVSGNSNWIGGESNQINGKKNTVWGKGNIIRGKGNVVANNLGDALEFDIESRFPAWMRSGSPKRSNSKQKKNRRSSRVQTNGDEEPIQKRTPFVAKTFRRPPAVEGDDFFGRPKWDVETPRGRNRQRSSRSSRRRGSSASSDRSSPLRESLRDRIQRQIDREFEGFGQ